MTHPDQDERQRRILTLTRDREALNERLAALPTTDSIRRYKLLSQIANLNRAIAESSR